VVEDGVTGFVAAAPRVDLFDGAMERAWERRNDWQEIGRCAATRIRELAPRDPIAEFAAEIESLGKPTLMQQASA
jgi:hypothetical protein